MIVRIRTAAGTWRIEGLTPKSQVKDLVKSIETTHDIIVKKLSLKQNMSDPVTDAKKLTKSLKDVGIQHGTMVYAEISGKGEGGTATVLVGGKRTIIDAQGKVVSQPEENGIRPGLQSLRTQKLHWNLTDYVEFDEKYTYHIRAEKRKFCAQASLDAKSCQSIQAYMESVRFSTCRCAILYGKFVDSPKEKEKKEKEALEAQRRAADPGYGSTKRHMKLSDLPPPEDELAAKQGVRVEAMYEPRQNNSPDGFVLLEDERGAKVDAIAAALGLHRVGLLVAHPARENYNFSTKEILVCAEQALEATQGERESPFVIIKVSPNDGFEAWSLNPICLDMVAEGAILQSDSPGISAVHQTFTAVVEAKDAKVIDNDLFIQRVPIVQHDSPIAGSGKFPRYNREFADAPSTNHFKSELKGIGRNPTPKDLMRALSDFHILIYLSAVFDVDQGLQEIAAWVGHTAFEKQDPTPLPEGYKVLIMNLAGLD